MTQFRAIRGMVDILPDATPLWQRIETAVRTVLSGYGYAEIRLPLLEATDLFARSIGEVTDIVEKEMYSFPDRNDDSLTLRPEGTAGCVRAAVQHNLAAAPQRLWYAGPMFRYERPQKGRQRQFHQVGVEAFGVAGPEQDAELILICRRLWQVLGVAPLLTLEINSIGGIAARQRFRDALVSYLELHREALDEDSRRRLIGNPLRILDSKNPEVQAVLDGAPRLADFLDDESRAHWDALLALLEVAGVRYRHNDRLVRGLDYYNRTVFEWTTDALGAQGTVCGGGRYDGLFAQFGGSDTPAAGFAIGMERLVLLCESLTPPAAAAADIYVVTADADAYEFALPRVEDLRTQFPELRIVMHLGGGSFKSQFKRADRSGARLALVYAVGEVAADQVTVKPLRDGGEQRTIAGSALADTLRRFDWAQVED